MSVASLFDRRTIRRHWRRLTRKERVGPTLLRRVLALEKLDERTLLAANPVAPEASLAVVRQLEGNPLLSFLQNFDGDEYAEHQLDFGNPNDGALRPGGKMTPVVGDWTNSGFDWPGVVLEHHNGGLLWRLDNDGDVFEDHRFFFGLQGYQVQVGHFNNDEYLDIAAIGPSDVVDPVVGRPTLKWHIAFGPLPDLASPRTDTFLKVDKVSEAGFEGDKPVVGDFNGDGIDELGVISKDPVFNNGVWVHRWYISMPTGVQTVDFGPPDSKPVVGNWDGIGGDNVGVVWQRPGAKSIWYLDTNGDTTAEIQFEYGLGGQEYYFSGNWWEPERPTAELLATDVTVGGGSFHDIKVVYRDNVAIDVATVEPSNISVLNPNSAVQPIVWASVDQPTDGSPRVVTYRVAAPGGSWDLSDNGDYEVSVKGKPVGDTSGNTVATTVLGKFKVTVPDWERPQAQLLPLDPVVPGAAYHQVRVRYTDNVAVDVSDFDGSDIRVTGPTGAAITAFFVGSDSIIDGTPRTATYRVIPPGGGWDAADNGRYEIYLQANEISDTSNNFALARKLGEFLVNVATSDNVPPTASLLVQEITTGGGVSHTLTVTYADNRAVDVSSLTNSDIRVTGPNGYDVRATYKGVTPNSNGTPRVASYEIAAPGGTWNSVDTGEYTVSMMPGEVRDTSGNSVPPGELGRFTVTLSDFNIDVIFQDNSFSASQRAVFESAASRWEQIIIGDLPDVHIPGLGDVDDVAIYASASWIDGPGGYLGFAGPRIVRKASSLPVVGEMTFDSADLQSLELNNRLLDIVLHEMGHALGIGTIWMRKNLLTGAGTADPRFTGSEAAEEYRKTFKVTDSDVPVENTGAEATRDSHWRESVFDNELMTGWIDIGRENPLSRITAASLADLGYAVNLAAADPYPSNGNSGVVLPLLPLVAGRLEEPSETVEFDFALASQLGIPTAMPTYLRTTRVLSVDVPTVGITESGAPVAATVTRTVIDDEAIIILSSSDSDRVSVPATVTMPAGVSSATFVITPVDDDIFRGQKTITITAEAINHTSHTASFELIDDDSIKVLVSGPDRGIGGNSYPLTLDASSDPAIQTGLRWIVDWGDGTPEQVFDTSSTYVHAYPEAGATYTIHVELVGPDGIHVDDASKAIQILNVLPQAVRSGKPYVEDFTDGLPSSGAGMEFFSNNQGRYQIVNGALRQDDAKKDKIFSLVETILHLDLAGQENVQLSADYRHFSKKVDRLPSTFVGHANGDGVAISADGFTWYAIPGVSLSGSGTLKIDLDDAIRQLGLEYTSDFQVKFQQYGNQPAKKDGLEWDNIRVEIVEPPTAQRVAPGQPYVEDFSHGLPQGEAGLEYYSTSDGRILFVDGSLRFDVKKNKLPALNEMIVHLDLAGQENVQLSADYRHFSKKVDQLPSTFVGHANGDGVAISADGYTWYAIPNVSLSGSGMLKIDLDDAIRQLGLEYTSDFQVKFQQYGNQPAKKDGLEWDNIRVEIVEPPTAQKVAPGQPYVEGFSHALPQGEAGVEYYSTSDGRILIVDGSLRFDDVKKNKLPALNEMIVHLDLAGQENVQLSADYRHFSKKMDRLPSEFVGHANGDGIAISADGYTWYAIPNVSLSGSGTLKIDLDGAIGQLGLAYTSDFQVKFQQYGNQPAKKDGLEWDNIRVETPDLLDEQLPLSDAAVEPWQQAVDRIFHTDDILS